MISLEVTFIFRIFVVDKLIMDKHIYYNEQWNDKEPEESTRSDIPGSKEE